MKHGKGFASEITLVLMVFVLVAVKTWFAKIHGSVSFLPYNQPSLSIHTAELQKFIIGYWCSFVIVLFKVSKSCWIFASCSIFQCDWNFLQKFLVFFFLFYIFTSMHLNRLFRCPCGLFKIVWVVSLFVCLFKHLLVTAVLVSTTSSRSLAQFS